VTHLGIERMRKLIDGIIADGDEMRRLYGHDHRAKPNPPLPKKRHLAKRIADRVPAAYRRFLSIHDGVTHLDWVDVSLLGVEALEASGPIDRDWARAQGLKANQKTFIFGWSDSDSHVLAFLPLEHMAVIDFDSRGVVARYPSFDDYLRGRRRWFRKWLKAAQATGTGQ
jgi:hypothetical protein